MMQFGLVSYQDQPDYAASLAFVDHYRRTGCVDAQGHALLRAAVASHAGISKAALIAARLYFWNQLERHTVLQDLSGKLNAETFAKADVFEKQELCDCLGPALLSDFIDNSFDTRQLDSGWERSDGVGGHGSQDAFDSLGAQADEVWCYIPPPTGFFSVIENIVLAQFFCLVHNKRFKLDLQHDWWRYPVAFMELMDGGATLGLDPGAAHQKYIVWNVVREYFRYISPASFGLLRQYKVRQYGRIKQLLRGYLDQHDLRPRPDPEDALVFVRGGDKIQLETIEAPREFLYADIQALRGRAVAIRILSDDHALAERLVTTLELPASANLTEPSRAGYHLHAGHNRHDVHTIIHNYLMLSNARYSISCPSSNLVNSAHWSNRILDTEFHPRSLPALRYLYL